MTGWQEEQHLVLSIQDNGIGMAEKELARWQSALTSDQANLFTRSRHIGILNVQGQIQRIFGPDYGLALTAAAAEGMVITIPPASLFARSAGTARSLVMERKHEQTCRILVADDERMIRQGLQTLLTRHYPELTMAAR